VARGAQLTDGGPRWGRRPVLAGLLGATAIAFSAILVRLADESPSTAAVFRCAYAVPLLAVLAARESRLYGPRPARDRWIGVAAGFLFSADLITWHHSIANVGAGLATVLGNLQVVLVAFAAWAVLGERPERRIIAAVPVVFTGAVMISGVLESGGYGRDPVLGTVFGLSTTLAYAAFILVLRQVNRDLRRPAGPLLDATAAAAVVSAVAGAVIGDVDLVPSWPSHAWLALLALTSQVLGWLLISVSLPRLPAALTSVLLLVQPVGSVVLAVIILGEEPSALQLAGTAVILAGICLATLTWPRRRAPVTVAPPPPVDVEVSSH
jgi:drug/metabolite transporter (DMT)-like permease